MDTGCQKNNREATLTAHLALHRSCVYHSNAAHKLLDKFHNPSHIFNASIDELVQASGTNEKLVHTLKNPDWRGVEKDLHWLEQPGHSIVLFQDETYPNWLRTIDQPPYLLFIAGDPAILSEHQISIVGSRKATAAGKNIANRFARELSRLGITITSGLAAGIDSASHAGALAEDGRTIAVLGNGPDRIYPSHNRKLFESIALSGAVLSEFPTTFSPLKQHFPLRNRIISGLSLGTLVVEAAQHSGSLITARLAAEQGREVFAVPGSILNPMSTGCHYLIKQGAKLTESVSDILEELLHVLQPNIENVMQLTTERPAVSAEKQDVFLLRYLEFEPKSVNQLVDMTGLTAAEVSSMLLNMEIEGLVVSQLDGTYQRVK